MEILDRYIGRAVIGGTLLVMLVLLALFSFAAFVGELDVIGKGDYTLAVALEYVLLTLPRLSYELFPMSSLLGSMMGLGILASNSELIVMRAAGISLSRIALSVMKAALLIMIFAILLGEFVAPRSEQFAQDMRSIALAERITLKTKDGFWTRDGNNFINVRAILSGGELAVLDIYEFDRQHHLKTVTNAKRAIFDGDQWVLKDIKRSEIGEDRVTTKILPEAAWNVLLKPEVLDVIAIKPSSLSAWGLYQYITYLIDNNLNAARYEKEFWAKMILPFSTGVMVFLSIPFIFGPLRSVGVGQRIMVGSLVGIGFYVFSQIFSYGGLAYQVNAFISAVLPTVLFLMLSIVMMRRIF